MRFDRRSLLAALAAIGLFGLMPGAASAQTYNKADLEVAGPLGDRILGNANAPVTIIEYASMTCPHCQHFHTTTFPELKAKYIDTGKVRFIFREYPLDGLAAVASMIARCAPEDQFYPLVSLMFEHQKDWAYVDDGKPLDHLYDLVKQTGFTQESFKACWQNQKTLDGVTFSRNRASEKFGVNGTPTFFINGVKKSGDIDLGTIEETAGDLLKQ
jgi:protein-disulfide isomerase